LATACVLIQASVPRDVLVLDIQAEIKLRTGDVVWITSLAVTARCASSRCLSAVVDQIATRRDLRGTLSLPVH
jgi:hypothetical protein